MSTEPKVCRPLILGLDEAGRGCVLGPLVVAGVLLDPNGERVLREHGVRDSKTVSSRRREKLLRVITTGALLVEAVLVGVEEIERGNLNRLTLNAMMEIAEDAMTYMDVDVIVMDSVGKRFRMKRKVGEKIVDVIMEDKADRKYVAVSAASIVAKVLRDRILRLVSREYGVKGSGYPSDPRTVAWLLESYSLAPEWLIRRRWKTVRTLAARKKIGGLDTYIGEESHADESAR